MKTTRCKYCGTPTPMLNTRQCDGCWEIAHRIRAKDVPTLARIIAVELADESLQDLLAILLKDDHGRR